MAQNGEPIYAMDPPPGVTRDPNQPNDAAPLTIVTILSFTLATISMVLRLYARQGIVGKLRLDDCELL
jgi:hypothetical protein